MKLHTTIPDKLKYYYERELDLYRSAYKCGNLNMAWHYLERAHVIGQNYPYAHSYVHWKMLQFGFRIKSRKEIIGQIPRLIFGGIKSFVGKVPTGNTGGSNVPPLKSLPIDADIQKIFDSSGVS